MEVQFCKKGAPPSKLNSIAKLMVGNWIGEFNRNRQWLSARPSQFQGNFSRRPFNNISVQGNCNVSLICPYLSKTKSDQSKKDFWDTWNKICTLMNNNRASKSCQGFCRFLFWATCAIEKMWVCFKNLKKLSLTFSDNASWCCTTRGRETQNKSRLFFNWEASIRSLESAWQVTPMPRLYSNS